MRRRRRSAVTVRGGVAMSIPEDRITKHLDFLLTSSDADSVMHHMHVIHAPAGAVGPLGTVGDDALEAAVYAIAPDGTVDAEAFVVQTVQMAAVEHARKGHVVLFAGLSQQTWAVDPMDALGHELLRKRRLFEHPRVADLTVVYAAARDGRRWRGKRWHSGPKAGQTDEIETLVGPPARAEGWGMRVAPFLRVLVGQQW